MNAPCRCRALTLGSHRRLFSIGARSRSRLLARGHRHARRDKRQPGCWITEQHSERYAKINNGSETERDSKTTDYECACRIARHRSPRR